ncbi:LCP family protein [Candidatus Microgenomates bacterium]|nr:LCP family protein [Candidatus Microgenomates bacterium]
MIKKKRAKKKKEGSLKRWFFVLGAICLFFILGKLIFSYRKRIWKNGRLNFVLASKPVLFFSLSPEEKSLTIVKIPQETYVEVTRGFGAYKIESVYPLGELEKKGGELLIETTQEFLGIPVEAYARFYNFQFPISNFQLNKEGFIQAKRKIASWGVLLRPRKVLQFLKEDLETNLSYWDIVKIWLAFKKVNIGKISFIDLGEQRVFSKFSLADGGEGKKGDPLLVDDVLQEFFFEPEIRKEEILIEVLNGTDYSGLAHNAARIISNIGGKVVRAGDNEEKVKKCQLKAEKQMLKSFTFLKIKKIFDCQVLEEEGQDLIMIVGDDYQRKLFSKE